MVGDTIIQLSSTMRTYDQTPVSAATFKKQHQVRSYDTDLTVMIGSGDAVKEFLCHSAILSFASTN
jgi:hypothetical protein